MKVIHVLRKPLSEPTVVANVLKHGCGALNIDATRITGEGASPSIARRASAGRAGVVPGTPVSTTGWHNRTDLANYTAERVGESIGRFPANLVLQHLDGCSTECKDGCPVAALDAQSGQSTTPTKVTRGAGGQHGAYSPLPAQGDIPSYGDTGGASRFFKQFGSS